jgi:hypothetical protein
VSGIAKQNCWWATALAARPDLSLCRDQHQPGNMLLAAIGQAGHFARPQSSSDDPLFRTFLLPPTKKHRAFLPSACFQTLFLVGGAGFEPATPAV